MLGLLASGGGGDKATNPSTLTYGWAIAVIIAVGANLMSNVGINTQKLALMKKAQGKPMGLVGTLWTLGFVGIVGGALCDFAALGFGAQSIVAPLGSISVVANVVVAPMILGEVPTRRDVLATLLIVAGCAVAVSFASHKDHIYPADELFDMYRKPNFYVYFTAVVVLVLLWLLAIRWMERVQATRGSTSPQYQRVFKFHRFSYAAISGIAGAQSVLFAKTCVELVTGAIAGNGAEFLTYVPTYAVLLAMALTITLQIYWLNCGLARWDALYNVPVFSSFWILVSVVGGGVFYDEFSSFGLLQGLLFPVGILLAIAGVYWLSQRGAESAAARRGSGTGLLHDGGWGDEAPLLDADAPAIARARATIQVAEIVFSARKLGLGLVRLAVRLVDATRPSRSRVAQVWAVLDMGAEAAEAAAGAGANGGSVQPGDLLVSVNGESLLDRWVSHTDAMRRIMHTERPLRLGFRVLSPAQRRLVAVDDVEVAELAADIGLLLSSRDDAATGEGTVAGAGGASDAESATRLGHRPRRHTAAGRGLGVGSSTPPRPRIGTASRGAAGARYGATSAGEEGAEGVAPGGGLATSGRRGAGSVRGIASADGAGVRGSEQDDPDCGLIDGWGKLHADGGSAQSYAGPGWSVAGSAAESARPTGSAAAADADALAAGVGGAAYAAGPATRRPRSGTGGFSVSAAGQAYIIAVYVDNAAAAVSPGRGIRTAHHALRNFVMDPMMGVFHMGGLVAPSVIFASQLEEGDAAAGPTEHPLVALVDGMFPHEGGQWSRLDRLLDTFGAGDKDAAGRAGGTPRGGSRPAVASLSAAGRSQSAYPARGGMGRSLGVGSGARGGGLASDRPSGTELVAFQPGSAALASREAAAAAAHSAAQRALLRAGAAIRAPTLSPVPSDSSADSSSPFVHAAIASPRQGLELLPIDPSYHAADSRRRGQRRSSLPIVGPDAATAGSPDAAVSPLPTSPVPAPSTYAQAAASGGAAAATADGAAHSLAAAFRRVEAAKATARVRAASAGFGLDVALHKAALLNGAADTLP